VVQLEHRFINLIAVPRAADQAFTTIAPGRWLLDHVPWSEAEHSIRAEPADARTASLLRAKPGTACLVIERRTWQRRRTITLARLVHPGTRHALTGRFRPASGTDR
jgi:GntR family histidine utilization transcriptional repressor